MVSLAENDGLPFFNCSEIDVVTGKNRVLNVWFHSPLAALEMLRHWLLCILLEAVQAAADGEVVDEVGMLS